MQTVNIPEARRHLSRLVEKAFKGEAFIIARAGKPPGESRPLEKADATRKRRIAFPE